MNRRFVALAWATMAASANGAYAQTAFDVAPMEESALSASTGREDTNMVAQSNSNATVTRNSVGDNATTGDVRVDDQAFQNLSGLSLLNINTGNNVAMNASMNVNIAINPGP
jgi:hypothetical protein